MEKKGKMLKEKLFKVKGKDVVPKDLERKKSKDVGNDVERKGVEKK